MHNSGLYYNLNNIIKKI